MAREDAQIKLYVPHELRDQLKSLAAKNKRSMNAESLIALEKHLHGRGPSTPNQQRERDGLAHIESMVEVFKAREVQE